MKNSNDLMRACSKFDRCSAPICPLDPDWPLRKYRKCEPICFYLLECVKPDADAQFQGCMAMPVYQAIKKSFDALMDRYAPIRRALERAKRTGSRMTVTQGSAHHGDSAPLGR